MTEISGIDNGMDNREEPQTARRAHLTVTPAPKEEAGRLNLSGLAGVTRSVGSRGRDVLSPVILIARGLRRGFVWVWSWWRRTDKERRKVILLVVALAVIAVAMLPRGPWILAGALVAAAVFAGRTPSGPSESPQQLAKLQAIYNGLVAHFMDEHDPDQTFVPGGEFGKAFDQWCFDEFGQLVKLDLHYSAFFKDGEPEQRAQVERAIERKAGPSHHFMYEWNEEENQLAVAIVPSRQAPPMAEMAEAPTEKVRPPQS